MAHEEENQAQRPAPVQIMQSITITPTLEFSLDAKLGTSMATRWNNCGRLISKCIQRQAELQIPSINVPCCCIKLDQVREIFWQITKTGRDTDYNIAKQKLKVHFDRGMYRFRQAAQEPNETLDQCYSRLRVHCRKHANSLIFEEHIIVSGASTKIWKRTSRDPSYDWNLCFISRDTVMSKVLNIELSKSNKKEQQVALQVAV